jgi:hypothetical protein
VAVGGGCPPDLEALVNESMLGSGGRGSDSEGAKDELEVSFHRD